MRILTQFQRAQLVREAKTWIGTPYRGHSCVKSAGVDCGQLIYGVYRNCGLVPVVDLPKDYSLQIAQHRASTEYVRFVDRFMRPVDETEAQPGDVSIYKLGLGFSHAAIIVEWPGYVIQAEQRHGVSGAHGIKTPAFRNAPREIRTLREQYTIGGF